MLPFWQHPFLIVKKYIFYNRGILDGSIMGLVTLSNANDGGMGGIDGSYSSIGSYLADTLKEDDGRIDSGSTGNNSDGDSKKEPTNDCVTLFGDPNEEGTPAFYMVIAFNVIKYVAIILLIGLSLMDLLGAVASQDNDSLKKAVGKIFKRVILCVILLLLPTIIDWVLGLMNDAKIKDCLVSNGVK